MARAIWTGTISFGLVSVQVGLHVAVRPKTVRFHMLHDADGERIVQKRFCSEEAKEVPYEHIVKGYEFERGKYVTVTREELERLDPKATHSVDIEDFVDLAEIDPIYYDATYYVVPDKRTARPYALLLAAMEKTGKVGIGRFVLREKEHLCAIRPIDGALCLSTMLYADEVVPASKLEGLPEKKAPAGKELQMAEQLIDALAGPFQPKKYKDSYRERVIDLLEKKASGKKIALPKAKARAPKVVDLMSALKKSLASVKRPAAKAKKAERTHRAAAKRPKRTRSVGREKR